MILVENKILGLDDASALDDAWRLGCTGYSADALCLAESILELAEQRADHHVIARSSQDSAWYCLQLGKAERGLVYADRAVIVWRQLQESALEAQALSIKAWLNLEVGQPEHAIELSADALNIADQSGDLRTRSLAINVIGVIFWTSRQPQLAIDYCGRAVELAREAQDSTFECWWLINLGGSHAEAAYLASETHDKKSFDNAINLAIDATNQAYVLAQTLKDAWAERLCLGNLAEYFNAIEDFLGAEAYLARYRSISSEDDVRGHGHYLDILGRTLISLKRYEEALVPLQQAHRLATENVNVETMMFSSLYLSKAHENLGAFEHALDFHKRYHSLHQQLTAERIRQNARMVEIRYETKKLKTLLDKEAERSATMTQSLEALQQRTNVLAVAANTDALTGLFNRRRLEAMFVDIDTSREGYALAIIDVDHFKKVNDTFSHLVGDKVLMQIGSLIQTFTRDTDLAVRFGGEEFVVLIPGITLTQARKTCERLRMRIERHEWFQIAPSLDISVSIGIAMSDDAENAEAVLELADKHLYTAKQTGRNKVVWMQSQARNR